MRSAEAVAEAVPTVVSDLSDADDEAPSCPQSRRLRQTEPTVRLDIRDLRPSWPVALATLEQLADWAPLALRLGVLALIQSCVRDLARADARAEIVVRLRELTEALAHMPSEV